MCTEHNRSDKVSGAHWLVSFNQLIDYPNLSLLFGISGPIPLEYFIFQKFSRNPHFYVKVLNFSDVGISKTPLPYVNQTKDIQPLGFWFANLDPVQYYHFYKVETKFKTHCFC